MFCDKSNATISNNNLVSSPLVIIKPCWGEIVPGLWIGNIQSILEINGPKNRTKQNRPVVNCIESKEEEEEKPTNSTNDELLEWTIISVINSKRLQQYTNTIITEIQTKQDQETSASRSPSTRIIIKKHIIWELPDKSNANFLSIKLDEIMACIDQGIHSVVDSFPKNRHSCCCLVHCVQGISRSPAVCIAWLLSRQYDTTLVNAMDRIRSVRTIINPNIGFVASLRAIEQCNGNIVNAIYRHNVSTIRYPTNSDNAVQKIKQNTNSNSKMNENETSEKGEGGV